MKIITSKRQEGRTTKLIEEWKKTGGLLIASSCHKKSALADADRSDCFFATYEQTCNRDFLRGRSIDYIYIDDIDIFLRCFFNMATLSMPKIIGTICESNLQPLSDDFLDKKCTDPEDCVTYTCPCCGKLITHVDKRTTHTARVALHI